MIDLGKLGSACIECILSKHLNAYPEGTIEEKSLLYKSRVLSVFTENEDMSAPEAVCEINSIKEEMFGKGDDFGGIKSHFNLLMLKEEGHLEKMIREDSYPLKKAMLFAMLGNYIDFGAIDKVDEKTLLESFENARWENRFDLEFENLIKDLEKAKKLLYITDNCGEIVADKLFIKEIMKAYPDITIKVLVRGKDVLNDTTIKDAKEVGITDLVTVISNGTGIPGTSLKRITDEAKEAVKNADLIISKGQGNFETLMYSGKNIYYIFMCKCSMFAKRFNVAPLSGMLLNDLRMGK